MSMVERAARELCRQAHLNDAQAELYRPGEIDAKVEAYWPKWVSAARAVLTALMEPSEGMLDAVAPFPKAIVAQRNDPEYANAMRAATLADRATARSSWQDMLTAALEEG